MRLVNATMCLFPEGIPRGPTCGTAAATRLAHFFLKGSASSVSPPVPAKAGAGQRFRVEDCKLPGRAAPDRALRLQKEDRSLGLQRKPPERVTERPSGSGGERLPPLERGGSALALGT